VSPASVISSNTVTGTVTLTAPAPAGGSDVELADYETIDIPPYVTVPEGMTVASFQITTPLVESTDTRVLHADDGAVSREASLEILAPPDGVVDLSLVSPGELLVEGDVHAGGEPLDLFITVTPEESAGTAVLTSSSPDIIDASPPPRGTVPITPAAGDGEW
jgi:hypothetical protein